jgi:hypothetical protein
MSKDPATKTRFDASKFKMQSMDVNDPVAQKVIIRLPIKKPHKEEFVRCLSSDEYQISCGIYQPKDEERIYLVAPDIAHLFGTSAKHVSLRLGMNRQGKVFLWPVPLPPEEGKENQYHQTHREIAEVAVHSWVKMQADTSCGFYDYHVAVGKLSEPVWPTTPFEDLLEIAFGSSGVIEDRDHPTLRQLEGRD